MGLAALLVAAVAAAGSVYWWIYRPDRLTNAASQQRVTDAAREGTVALLSHAPETLDKDLATAKSHLTGEFLKYYSDFTDKIVAPAANRRASRPRPPSPARRYRRCNPTMRWCWCSSTR